MAKKRPELDEDLTDNERAAFKFIRAHYAERGAWPSFRTIGAELQISATAVGWILKRLELKGFIEKQEPFKFTSKGKTAPL